MIRDAPRGPRRRRSGQLRRLLAGGGHEVRLVARGANPAALGRLLAIVERHPDLKANQQFARVSDEFAETENRIAVERIRYNDTVRDYNAYIKSSQSSSIPAR